jgi:hypothetical protein
MRFNAIIYKFANYREVMVWGIIVWRNLTGVLDTNRSIYRVGGKWHVQQGTLPCRTCLENLCH